MIKSKENFTIIREEEILRDETLTNLFRSFGAIYVKSKKIKSNERRNF